MDRVTIQQILQQGYAAFERSHPLPGYVRKAVWALLACRTARLGGHIQACPEGHVKRVWDNSCRHRLCPQCAWLQVERWLDRQKARLLACIVLGGFAREWADRLAYQMDLPLPLGRIAQIAVVAVFAITAAAQVAVSTAILMVLVALLVAAIGATFALAFGLGGREVARELSAGRYLRTAYRTGQEISFGDVHGRIESIDTAATVLRTEQGTVRVPNNMLLGSVVTVHEADADSA